MTSEKLAGGKLAGVRGILFDKDGTLLDYDASWLPVNRELARIAARGDGDLADRLLKACGMDPVSGHVAADSLLAAGNTRQIAEGLIAAGSAFAVDDLTLRLDQLFSGAAQYAVPVTDLGAFFRRLRRAGYCLGVASSDNETSIRETARRFGFLDCLDYIAGYDSGFGAKPEPGMVQAFCHATGLAASQVAMVGDNNHDLHMGRNAGVALNIGVLTGTGSIDSLSAAADLCLDNITLLEPLLPGVPAGS